MSESKIVRALEKEVDKLNERIKALETVMQKCIKAMKGSNCLEEQWLTKALEG